MAWRKVAARNARLVLYTSVKRSRTLQPLFDLTHFAFWTAR